MLAPTVGRVPLQMPWLAVAFAAGVVGTEWVGTELMWKVASAIVAGAASATTVSIARRRWPHVLVPLILLLGLGGLRGASAAAGAAQPWDPGTSRIDVLGSVEAPAETRGSASLVVLRIEHVEGAAPPPNRESLVQLVLDPLPPLGFGDQVRVVGRFEPVSSTEPAAQALRRRGVVAISRFPDVERIGAPSGVPAWALALNHVRSSLESALQQALPEPHAGLMGGLLVGSRGNFSEELRQAFVASGTSHLVVVSGYNISLVAGALLGLLRGRQWLGTVIPLSGIWLFTLLAGAAPPAVRAAIMATAALLALRLGRGGDPLGALALTAAAMLAWTPGLARELGFQLSVLATLGLVTLQPRVSALLPRLPGYLREPTAGTLAAQLATVPVLAASFHQISSVAPLSNVLAAPAVPVATISAMILAPLIAVVPAAAPLGGLLLAIPSTYLLAVIQATASLPQAMLPVPDLPLALTMLYGLALLAWAAFPTPEGQDLLARLRSAPRVTTALVALPVGGALGLMGTGLPPAAPVLSVSLFETGGTPALFARTPAGHTVLIDAGRGPSTVVSQLGRRLGLAERHLTLIVLTRADPDRLSGVIVAAERYPPSLAFGPSESDPTPLLQRWEAATAGRLIPVGSPMVLELEPGLRTELYGTAPVLGPGETQPRPTLVARLVYENSALLFAPTATAATLASLAAEGADLRADVLVVPRAGAVGGLNPSVMAIIRPTMAILPIDTRARAGPDPNTLTLLSEISILRTDEHGEIRLELDGRRVRATTERGTLR